MNDNSLTPSIIQFVFGSSVLVALSPKRNVLNPKIPTYTMVSGDFFDWLNQRSTYAYTCWRSCFPSRTT